MSSTATSAAVATDWRMHPCAPPCSYHSDVCRFIRWLLVTRQSRRSCGQKRALARSVGVRDGSRSPSQTGSLLRIDDVRLFIVFVRSFRVFVWCVCIVFRTTGSERERESSREGTGRRQSDVSIDSRHPSTFFFRSTIFPPPLL